MNPIIKTIKKAAAHAREKRAVIFRNSFLITENTRVLDLGSENGSNINKVLEGTKIKPNNVYIADINLEAVNEGKSLFGFNPVHITEGGPLPFEDGYFDIVYCSSVIEHVTVPKEKVWRTYSTKKFRDESLERQKEFADEIKRLSKQYFVQTPYKYFPIESHCWLPFIAWFPRWIIIPVLWFTNMVWVKGTSPDWYLLNKREMELLFDNAKILQEKSFGLTKSIMAVVSNYKHTP